MRTSVARRAIFSATAMALLAGCGGSMSPSTTMAGQQNRQTVKHRTSTCPCLYVPNTSANSVTVYAAGAEGNAKPIQVIAGSNTGLDVPDGVAVDGSANVYVSNRGNSVTVYAAGSTGNVTPAQTISGSATGLDRPFGIALDPVNGDIYVANSGGGPSGNGSLTIYASNATGDAAPIGTISGSATGLSEPAGLVLDANGNIYVPNYGNASITVYAAGSTGNAAPMQTISGSNTGLAGDFQLALNSSATMIDVANYSGNTVSVFAAGANGNVAPTRTIAGKKTKLNGPDGVALDSSGNQYVADAATTNMVTVFAAGSQGDVKPSSKIKGKKTELNGAEGIALR
jgi:serine/threonine protein kinase, bacterial